MRVAFNHAYQAANTERYLTEVLANKHWSGDGPFSKKCSAFLKERLAPSNVLLTPSGTDALEMCALLLELQPGDEVIMPSFTFSSTANAFVLRGAVPVFIDIRRDTLNIDETLLEAAITEKTKAVCVVHYAGIACEMDHIKAICKKHNLPVVEDAAHALGGSYKGVALGTIGDLNAFSFHETKNFSSGEGGAFTSSSNEHFQRAEIIREKGTNRSQFFRGQVDKYRWVDLGSSFLPSEFQAAVLWSHLENFDLIQTMRMHIWTRYHLLLEGLEKEHLLRRPIVPEGCEHSAHLYYILLKDLNERTCLMHYLKDEGISSFFHYVPLHSAPAGQKFGRVASDMTHTDNISDQLLRLPFWAGLRDEEIDYVVERIHSFFKKQAVSSAAPAASKSK